MARLRVDKMTLAALDATLLSYQRGCPGRHSRLADDRRADVADLAQRYPELVQRPGNGLCPHHGRLLP
ncbi:MAG: hypothetical protein R3A10_15915 [Caldilineaceae bacterium]